MVIKTVCHFVDSNLGVEMSSKLMVNRKIVEGGEGGGEFWKLFYLVGGK